MLNDNYCSLGLVFLTEGERKEEKMAEKRDPEKLRKCDKNKEGGLIKKRKPRGPYLQYLRNDSPTPKRSRIYWAKK